MVAEGDLAGGCACGAMRYRLTDPPMFVHCCHCTECQRLTGSAFVINALIEADRMAVGGAPEPSRVPTASGRPHDVYRCPRCRTALWSDYGGRGWLRFVRAGTLDHPAQVTPDVHIYVRSKLPWVRLPEGVPVFPDYYDMPALWPAANWARLGEARAQAEARAAAGEDRAG